MRLRGKDARLRIFMMLGFSICLNCAQQTEDQTPSPRTERPAAPAQVATKPEPVDWESMDKEITDSNGMSFVLIPPGSFEMGSETGDEDEKPVHTVILTKPYYLGKHEVTQKQWRSIMAKNPSTFKGDNLPVESISWNQIQVFLRRINQFEGRLTYRLPTEAEWEYAARAGGPPDQPSSMNRIAWYKGNAQDKTHPVGLKRPNEWGLHDIYGNVWEWCRDRYGPYPARTVTDPIGVRTGTSRIFRGGSWVVPMQRVRATNRDKRLQDFFAHNIGFRLVKIIQ